MPRTLDPKIKIKQFESGMKELKKRIVLLEKEAKTLNKEVVNLSKQSKASSPKKKAIKKVKAPKKQD